MRYVRLGSPRKDSKLKLVEIHVSSKMSTLAWVFLIRVKVKCSE